MKNKNKKILSEVSKLETPIKKALSMIQKELISAIYGNYYDINDDSLEFLQIPYFMAIEKLESEKESLIQNSNQINDEFIKIKVKNVVLI